LIAGLAGCQTLGKKNSSGDTPFLGANSGDKAKSAAPTDPLAGPGPSAAEMDGLLTGQVIDSIGRPAEAQIRCVCLDDGKDEDSAAAVAVDPQGYFMIKGLKAGKQYKLVTRAKSGDKTLENVTYTRAPNTRLLIELNERFVVPSAPSKTKDKSKQSADNSMERPASATLPAVPVPANPWQQEPAASLPPPPPIQGARKTQIAEGNYAAAPKSVLGQIPVTPVPNPNGWTNPSQGPAGLGAPMPAAPSPLSVNPGPAPVPSSVKIGLRLENFALYDLDLQPWELKTNRLGKLVLLDFWKTTCPPCVQAITTLRILQDKWSTMGLEVVGIAYEDSGTQIEQAHNVKALAAQRRANYQLLLGGGAKCPLSRDMQIRGFPTLVLLDQTGAVIWRHEGALDREKMDELEFVIRRRLTPED
jgi:thiol-disulfide isomerase/thioredoxin